MGDTRRTGISETAVAGRARVPRPRRWTTIDVLRKDRVEHFLESHSSKPSAPVQWEGIAIENYKTPAIFIPRHEHLDDYLQVALGSPVKYEVSTKGRNLRFTSRPGTIFLLPRGTVDETNWGGRTHRIAVAIHRSLLTNALDETAHLAEIELTEHWNLIDRHISALLMEMTADLEDGSPAGTIYGEALANTLAVYLVKRYAVRQATPTIYKGGLTGFRLKRVLEYIAASLDENIRLSQLAAIAGMSPHYFSELFKQSTGHPPHSYVLLQRIERAKQQLRDPQRSIIDAGLAAGFQNASHFARMFRQMVGTTPSRYRADNLFRTT